MEMQLKEKKELIPRLPEWLKKNVLLNNDSRKVYSIIKEFNLNTVCQSARCPNKNECFSNHTATFMINGNTCTRGCTFCSVPKGKPENIPDVNEPDNVVRASKLLGLKHVVVTSVNRDDLEDQGSNQFAKTIVELRKEIKEVTIEVLTPDFKGSKLCIKNVAYAKPDVYNHNLETVPRLYKEVRPGAIYKRSLELIEYVKFLDPLIITKSGLMLGLGELGSEVIEVLEDLFKYKCDYVTLGQYMMPTINSYPVQKYLTIEEFEKFKNVALKIGFKKVFSGPLVRSSYHARELYEKDQ